MWQRFTEMARKAVFYAQEEAQKYGEGYVSTEHFLLGLLREEENVACQTLIQMGASLKAIRSEVERHLPRGDARPSQDMTLTPRAKRVIDLAYEEARGLSNDYIGTEHLLLGLLREGDGLAGKVLAKLGIHLDPCRDQVVEVQDAEHTGREPKNPAQDPTTHAAVQRSGKLRKLLGDFPDATRDAITGKLLAIRLRRAMPEMLALLALSEPHPALEELILTKGFEPFILVGAIEGGILAKVNSEDSSGPTVTATLQTAQNLAGEKPLHSGHVILALLQLGNNEVVEVFNSVGITAEDIRSVL
jgi:hypothetical protein